MVGNLREMAATLREVANEVEGIQQPEPVVTKTADWVLDSEKVLDFVAFYAVGEDA